MEQFYVTLPCKFNKNTQANYTTQLQQNVNLPGSWAVGLSEISFSKTWSNIISTESVMLLYFDSNRTNGINKSIIEEAVIPKNMYTKEYLIETINDAIKLHFDDMKNLKKNTDIQMETIPTVNFNRKTNTFVLCKGKSKNHSHGYLYVLPSPNLCEIIGFDYQEILVDVQELFEKYLTFFNANKNSEGKLPDNLKLPEEDITIIPRYPYSIEPVKLLYVMSDICNDRIFGATRRDLLRIVDIPFSANYGDQITISYSNPQYTQVKKNNFKEINIKIRQKINYSQNLERNGEHVIEFQGGLVLLTLHFKKISDKKIPITVLPTGGSQKLTSDYEFIDASIPKITAKNNLGNIVPFSCDPLYYYNCSPIEPIIIKNVEENQNNPQSELTPILIKNEDITNTPNNENTNLPSEFKLNEKWTHYYGNIIKIDNKNFRYDCFKIEIPDGGLEEIKPALENTNSILKFNQINVDPETNKKIKYQCFTTELSNENVERNKRELYDGSGVQVGDLATRETEILQKLTKGFCDNLEPKNTNINHEPTRSNENLNTKNTAQNTGKDAAPKKGGFKTRYQEIDHWGKSIG